MNGESGRFRPGLVEMLGAPVSKSSWEAATVVSRYWAGAFVIFPRGSPFTYYDASYDAYEGRRGKMTRAECRVFYPTTQG